MMAGRRGFGRLLAALRGRGEEGSGSSAQAPLVASVAGDPDFESVLVWFDHNGYVPEVMATAARIAARRRHGLSVLVTIEVPAASPIDARMPDHEAQAESVLEEARLQAGSRRVSGRWVKVRAGQTGRRIIDEATAMHAGAIVMPMSSGSGAGFGRTAKAVLRDRPCRVIIESIPQSVTRGRQRTAGSQTT